MSNRKIKIKNELETQIGSNKSAIPSVNESVLPIINDKSITQHTLDILYSKYLQSLAIQQLISEKNKEIEQQIDEQLTYHSTKIQVSIEEREFLRTQIDYAMKNKDCFSEQYHLEKNTRNLVGESTNSKEIEELTQRLQAFCNKLYLEGIQAPSEEQLARLCQISEEIVNTTEEIKNHTNSDYFDYVENVNRIEKLFRKIENLQKNIGSTQESINKNLLKALSLNFTCKNKSNTHDITPI